MEGWRGGRGGGRDGGRREEGRGGKCSRGMKGGGEGWVVIIRGGEGWVVIKGRRGRVGGN